MEKISYKLDVFEGPMDLLLHLISKHKLNIYDIPIVTLVEQYIDYVRQMQEEDMYIAAEFLEMAARLVYLKSVSLLPVYTEAEELKQELQGELIEYRDMKLLAGKLSENTEGFGTFIRQPEKIDPDQTYKRLHDLEELFSAYFRQQVESFVSYRHQLRHSVKSLLKKLFQLAQRFQISLRN